MMKLLDLCYTPLPGQQSQSQSQEGGIYQELFLEQEGKPSHHSTPLQNRWILRANLLKLEEEILTQLEYEFSEMGGIESRRGVKNSRVTETYWTKEVQVSHSFSLSLMMTEVFFLTLIQDDEEKKRFSRQKDLERKAKVGKHQAHRRNILRRKQVSLPPLPPQTLTPFHLAPLRNAPRRSTANPHKEKELSEACDRSSEGAKEINQACALSSLVCDNKFFLSLHTLSTYFLSPLVGRQR
jgi:hypothetical protein